MPNRLSLLVSGLLFLVLAGGVAEVCSADIIPPERRIEWDPGIPGGIPYYPVGINVKDPPYGARGDGLTDDTAAIKKAIADCPDGKAVYFPAGTYRLTEGLDVCLRSIVLRGDGPTKTFLKCESTAGSIIYLRGTSQISVSASADGKRSWKGPVEASVTGGAARGSTSITVDDASQFDAGDYVLLDQENDPEVCGKLYAYMKRVIGQIVQVSAKAGNTLTLSRPLYYGYSPGFAVKIHKPAFIKGCGVEDLYLERVPNGGYDNIGITFGAHCWVKNVESAMTRKWHVRLRLSYGCEVRDSYFHDGHDHGGDASYGVGFFEKSTDCLVENNIFARLRHSMIFEYGGCGNVYGYNYSRDPINEGEGNTDWLMSDMALHGGFPYLNLFEGNIGAHIDCDNVLGPSRWNTFFRNHVERKSIPSVKYGLWAVEVQANNLYTNVVGNVLGTEGATGEMWRIGYDQLTPNVDPRVEATLLRHGNHDHVAKKTAWDPAIPGHVLPPSLYLKARPAFFGERPWPAIGPDLEPMVGRLPAKERYEALRASRSSTP